jgi:hypothetical protein
VEEAQSNQGAAIPIRLPGVLFTSGAWTVNLRTSGLMEKLRTKITKASEYGLVETSWQRANCGGLVGPAFQ